MATLNRRPALLNMSSLKSFAEQKTTQRVCRDTHITNGVKPLPMGPLSWNQALNPLLGRGQLSSQWFLALAAFWTCPRSFKKYGYLSQAPEILIHEVWGITRAVGVYKLPWDSNETRAEATVLSSL